MKNCDFKKMAAPAAVVAALVLSSGFLGGCGSGQKQTASRDFFTSGNREADQRAEQRMVKSEQLSGNGEGAGEKVKKASSSSSSGDKAQQASASALAASAPKAEEKKSLYERLGGEKQIALLVDDFVTRAMSDPRVNWKREGIRHGMWSLNPNQKVTWHPSNDDIARMKTHITQFIIVATGGPSKYEGKEMRQAHDHLHITNAEFDAAVGDFKASLDKLQVPNREQKEVLAIIESSRPQVAEER
jgi:hemoglobin